MNVNRTGLPPRGATYRAGRLQERARFNPDSQRSAMYRAGQAIFSRLNSSSETRRQQEIAIQARQDHALTRANYDISRLQHDATAQRNTASIFNGKLVALRNGSHRYTKTVPEQKNYERELAEFISHNESKALSSERKTRYKIADAQRFVDGTLDAICASAPLHESKRSKYAALYNITFNQQGETQLMHLDKSMKRQAHAQYKGQVYSYHEVSAETIKHVNNDRLRYALRNIPTGEAAKMSKGTKIELNLHGQPGSLRVKSSFNDSIVLVDDNDVADFLARHLKPGDYKYKLTIALSACYGAYPTGANRDGPSSLDNITQRLNAHNKVQGVRLTGTTVSSSFQTESDSEHLMGTRLYGGPHNKINRYI